MLTATTILPQTEASKQVVLIGVKRIIIGLWFVCVGQRRWDFQMQMLITPAAHTYIISSLYTMVIPNFVYCSLHGSS